MANRGPKKCIHIYSIRTCIRKDQQENKYNLYIYIYIYIGYFKIIYTKIERHNFPLANITMSTILLKSANVNNFNNPNNFNSL